MLNMISLDYDDTLMAAAGFQAEEIRKTHHEGVCRPVRAGR